MRLRTENLRMVGKLSVVALGMFAFGYAMIPLYRAICEATGINILSLSERQVPGGGKATIVIGPLKPGRYDFFGEYNEATAKGVVVVE